jgi:glycosyltransferase involved in cell wall biosynthesis/2-polyprenyl-3-methyl-5-hydroxy-6-metoxy-1,4-benzoquinol methylase
MVDVRRPCWCGRDDLRAFGAGYLRCAACDTLVGQVGLTDDETLVRDDDADFYGKNYWLEHQSSDLGLPDIYDRVRQDLHERCVHWLKTLLRYWPPPARVLDMGAGHGAYTALLNWAGYDAIALDLSAWVAEFAKTRFDIQYLVGSVEEQQLPRHSLDAVVANDLLEHLPDPLGTMRHCVELLRPDGVVVIQTPEFQIGRSYEELVADDDLFLQHIGRARKEHLYLFSRKSLRQLLTKVGIKHLAFEEPVYPYDMLCVASQAKLRRRDVEPNKLLANKPLVLALINAHDAWQLSEADRADRLTVIEALDEELKASEVDRAMRLETIEKLEADLNDAGADRDARASVIEPLDKTLNELAPRNVTPSTATLDDDRDPEEREPRITVITPVYNGAPLIEECLRSVLGQDYSNLEYIVVDGGSTDGTLEVVRRYEDRLAFWTSESDKGQADAINKGLRRSTGDVVSWVNADDFLYPGALAAVAEAYHANPRAPFYFGNGYRVDRKGRRLAEFFPQGRVHFSRDALVFGLNFVLQPSTFIRRAALEEVGLLDDRLHYGLDTDLWIRLSSLGPPRPVRKHLAASREYDDTKTSSGSFGRAEELRRIAEGHAHVGATPGAICYYLDTLHRLALKRPDVFPTEYVTAIESFWSSTAELMSRYGARLDGFPAEDASLRAQAVGVPRPKSGRQRVGIELRQVTRGASGGIVALLVGTLQEVFRQRQDLDFLVFCTVFNHELLAVDAPNVATITLPLYDYFRELARLARDYEIDILVRSYPSVDDLAFPLERQIFVLPDVQHEYYPKFFDAQTLRARRRAFRTPLAGAAAIMTISEHARRTIVPRAAASCDVFVASPGLPPEFSDARSADATDEERGRLPEGDFFYYPANLWPHKNHERLFSAFRRFRERTGSKADLVLTGAPSGWDALSERHADLPVRHLGFVSPALVRLIYERAIALTFFSEYEGFGIPVLEAFHVGTPVLCSSTTSLPEVAGDAALMCDPTDVDEMSRLLEVIAEDADLRAKLVTRGKKRARAYSWSKAGHKLSGGITRVLERVRTPDLPDRPLVSIVTPSYNQGRFLRRTIESVLAQSYSNVEYLVVDGGSTDETVDILRSYGDRIRWISEPDSGQSEAINKGLRAVSGEIIGYLNSDDILYPQAIETVVEQFRKNPTAALVYGDAEYIDEDGQVIGTYSTDDYSFTRLVNDCCICQPAAYWRTSAGKTVGPFDESLQYAMDFDFWLRFDRTGLAIQHFPQTIAQSRLHPGAKTLQARRAIYTEIFDVCRRHADYISRSYVDGYWHHMINERPHGLLRILRLVPVTRTVLVRLHYRWLNRHRYIGRQRMTSHLRAFRSRGLHRLRRNPRLFGLAYRSWLRLQAFQAWLGAPRRSTSHVPSPGKGRMRRVMGYWPDNWVGARLEVVVDARDQSRNFRLVGLPISEMTVVVSTAGAQLGQFELAQNGEQTVTVQLPPGPRETLRFDFSDHVMDGRGRPIAFLVQETDLFREDDLHALA